MGREGGSDKNNRFPRFGSGLVSAEAGALWLRNRTGSYCLGGKAWFLHLQCLGVVGVEPRRLRDIIHRLKRILTFEKAGKNNISFRQVSVVPCCQFIESTLKKLACLAQCRNLYICNFQGMPRNRLFPILDPTSPLSPRTIAAFLIPRNSARTRPPFPSSASLNSRQSKGDYGPFCIAAERYFF